MTGARITRRQAAGFVAGGLALAARPGAAQSPRPLLPVTVVLTATADGIPFYYAQQQGLFARAGLDVTANFVSSGSLAGIAVVGGAAQIGYSNVFSVITAHTKGIPFVLIAPGGQHDPAAPNSEIFVARDAPLRAAKDLEGRTVGVVSLHDLQTLATHAFLDQGGADAASVKFLELPQSAMLDALIAKRVDAIVSFEPFQGDPGGVCRRRAPRYTVAVTATGGPPGGTRRLCGRAPARRAACASGTPSVR